MSDNEITKQFNEIVNSGIESMEFKIKDIPKDLSIEMKRLFVLNHKAQLFSEKVIN
jgi:hypothetical protein